MNYLTITGNLGKDPVLTFSKDNKAIATLSLAVSQSTREGDKWKDGPTLWLKATYFGPIAERISDKYKKGDTLTISGKLVYEEYKTADGEERSGLKIIGNEIEKIDRAKEAPAAKSEKAPFWWVKNFGQAHK